MIEFTDAKGKNPQPSASYETKLADTVPDPSPERVNKYAATGGLTAAEKLALFDY